MGLIGDVFQQSGMLTMIGRNSVSKDAAYCFYCFLFRQEADHEKFGHVVFSKTGYDNWKHAYRAFPTHVGGVSGCHNKAMRCANDFNNQRACDAPHSSRPGPLYIWQLS